MAEGTKVGGGEGKDPLLDFVEGGLGSGVGEEAFCGELAEEAAEEFLETFGKFAILGLFCRDERVLAWVCLQRQLRFP